MSSDISTSITQHTVVVCVDKRERGIGAQAMLSKLGYKVVIAVSLYDALKYIAQEMPHLVITESLLADGTAATLFDRLQQHQVLRRTPILVHVVRKTREELAPLTSRKFAGFILGALEPRTFLSKVAEVIKSHSVVSPYFVTAEEAGLTAGMTVSIEATAVGRVGEQLVARSATEVDPAAALTCIPADAQLSQIVLRMASNLRHGDEIFNLFPLSRITGAGRKWVASLPEISPVETHNGSRAKRRRVLFFEPVPDRLGKFVEILQGYDIELLPVQTLGAAAAALRKEYESIDSVYLHELRSDAAGIEWKNSYAKIPAGKKPCMLVGTTSVNVRSSAAVRYIRRPFGLGMLVEMLQATFEKAPVIAMVAGRNSASMISGQQVRYQAEASLVGLDESGGVLQLKFPLLKGSRLTLKHEFLGNAWEGQTTVLVSGAAQSMTRADVFHVRFESVGAGMSKVKYWERISRVLAESATSQSPQGRTA